MHLANLNRLQEMAARRRALHESKPLTTWPTQYFGNGFFDEPCIQCGTRVGIQTRYTDMETGQVTYWCDADWDFWWMPRTYLPKLRAGEIHDVTDLFVSSVEAQLEGWPN